MPLVGLIVRDVRRRCHSDTVTQVPVSSKKRHSDLGHRCVVSSSEGILPPHAACPHMQEVAAKPC